MTVAGSNTGAIIGSSIGGVVGLAIIACLLFWLLFVSRKRSVDNDLANDHNVDFAAGEGNESRVPLSPSGARMIDIAFPEPFVVPEAEVGTRSSRLSTDTKVVGPGTVPSVMSAASAEHLGERRALGTTLDASAATPTSRGRVESKSSDTPSVAQATNFVQHADAGALDPETHSLGIIREERVELPPTYSSIPARTRQLADANAIVKGNESVPAVPGPES